MELDDDLIDKLPAHEHGQETDPGIALERERTRKLVDLSPIHI